METRKGGLVVRGAGSRSVVHCMYKVLDSSLSSKRKERRKKKKRKEKKEPVEYGGTHL